MLCKEQSTDGVAPPRQPGRLEGKGVNEKAIIPRRTRTTLLRNIPQTLHRHCPDIVLRNNSQVINGLHCWIEICLDPPPAEPLSTTEAYTPQMPHLEDFTRRLKEGDESLTDDVLEGCSLKRRGRLCHFFAFFYYFYLVITPLELGLVDHQPRLLQLCFYLWLVNLCSGRFGWVSYFS